MDLGGMPIPGINENIYTKVNHFCFFEVEMKKENRSHIWIAQIECKIIPGWDGIDSNPGNAEKKKEIWIR